MGKKMDANYHLLRLTLAEKIHLDMAQSGELWAIQNLLLLVSEAIADGAPLPPLIAQFISVSLRKIYEGEKADDAFGIKRKRGEKDTRRSKVRGFSMANHVERLIYHQQITLADALDQVAKKYSTSSDNVKRNWKKIIKK